MCYSKEVQLAASSTIFAACLFYYIYFSIRFSHSSKKWLRSFLNNAMLVFVCIGGHQFFEFLSLTTNNQFFYKVGLVVSISATYFMLRSLEILINKNVHSRLAWIFISVAAIFIFLNPVQFEGYSFHLRHYSTFIWAALWMLMFIYLHVCTFEEFVDLKGRKQRKTLILYLLALFDFSFILSAIYSIWGYFKYSVNVCFDSPSIWCTFFVLQAFVAPFFLMALPHIFKRPEEHLKQTVKSTLLYLFVSLGILTILILTLPFFNCLTWKFVFP